jgi:hypothetical protein
LKPISPSIFEFDFIDAMMLGTGAFVVSICTPFALQTQNVGKCTGMELQSKNLRVKALNLMAKVKLTDLNCSHRDQDKDQRSHARDSKNAQNQSFALHYLIRHRRLRGCSELDPEADVNRPCTPSLAGFGGCAWFVANSETIVEQKFVPNRKKWAACSGRLAWRLWGAPPGLGVVTAPCHS